MAVVGFPGQALGPDVVAHGTAVVGLGQLEAAKADALLLGRRVFVRGFDLHVRAAPVVLPVTLLGFQGLVQRCFCTFRQDAKAPLPKRLAA